MPLVSVDSLELCPNVMNIYCLFKSILKFERLQPIHEYTLYSGSICFYELNVLNSVGVSIRDGLLDCVKSVGCPWSSFRPLSGAWQIFKRPLVQVVVAKHSSPSL